MLIVISVSQKFDLSSKTRIPSVVVLFRAWDQGERILVERILVGTTRIHVERILFERIQVGRILAEDRYCFAPEGGEDHGVAGCREGDDAEDRGGHEEENARSNNITVFGFALFYPAVFIVVTLVRVVKD